MIRYPIQFILCLFAFVLMTLFWIAIFKDKAPDMNVWKFTLNVLYWVLTVYGVLDSIKPITITINNKR